MHDFTFSFMSSSFILPSILAANARAKNFSEKQKLFFVELVKAHNIIESKRYNAKTLGTKLKAWTTVEKAKRKKSKKELDRERQGSRRTGGGVAETHVDPIIHNIF